MECDGEVRCGGGQLEGAGAPYILAQNTCGHLVTVQYSHHITVTQVQPIGGETDRETERERERDRKRQSEIERQREGKRNGGEKKTQEWKIRGERWRES